MHKRLLICESLLDAILQTLHIPQKLCPCCKSEFNVYLPFGATLRKNALCPHCGSKERHRSQWLYYDQVRLLPDECENRVVKVLHFAPEQSFYTLFHNRANIDYYPVDFNPRFKGIRDVIDIQDIKYNDNMFDIILCNHVLEHVPNDYKAAEELHRVLKQGGIAYVNAPVFNSLEKTLETPEYNTPELRHKHYGHPDHLRKYGKDYSQRLTNAGFILEIIEPNKAYTDAELLRYGISKNEQIFSCKKST